jgi:hypothetical protein
VAQRLDGGAQSWQNNGVGFDPGDVVNAVPLVAFGLLSDVGADMKHAGDLELVLRRKVIEPNQHGDPVGSLVERFRNRVELP